MTSLSNLSDWSSKSFFLALPKQSKIQLTDLINSKKGNISFIPGKSVNYFVTTTEEIKANSFKLQQAKSNGNEIVSDSWLLNEAKRSPANIQSNTSTNQTNQTSNNFSLQIISKQSSTVSQQKESSVTIAKEVLPPTVTLILPATGPCTGEFQVALIGLNMIAGPAFTIKISGVNRNEVYSNECEFHSSTSIVCTIPRCHVEPGLYTISASNDGNTFGFGVELKLYDNQVAQQHFTSEQKISILRSQLQNVQRAITNIQKMEMDIRRELNLISTSSNLLDDGNQLDIGQKPNEPTKKILFREQFEREIRLFISSPFRDMREERDLIVKLVIPRIRKLCDSKDVIFSFIDLRWGVTGVQSEQAAMLLMCLREVERSNMVVGLFGERYGMCIRNEENNRKDDELLKQSIDVAAKEFPWINEYADRSVTEIEMRMVLASSMEEKPSWFYFRDPYYIEELPESQRALYKSEGPTSHSKLEALKTDIIQSGRPNRSYKRPNIMADQLFEDISSYIQHKYPVGVSLSPIDRETLRHKLYCRSLCQVYQPNEEQFIILDRFVAGDILKPFVITGDSGSGKSSLLANWSQQHGGQHPEDIVITFWIGASESSTNYTSLLIYLMSTINQQLSLENPKYDENNPNQISEQFGIWLENLDRNKKLNRRVVVILDGLDKLDERESARDLIWLPRSFPAFLRLIVSTSPGICQEVLKKRGAEIFQLTPLSEGQRKSFLRAYLNHFGKKLSDQQELKIAAASQTANPRYLKTLMDDICIGAIHEELSQRIDKCLSATNVSKLYEHVLERLEKDYDVENKGIVREFMSLIWAARRGLHLDDELKPLLEKSNITEKEWYPLFLVLEEILSSSAGLTSIATGDLRTAVINRYLQTIDKQRAVHNRLAQFFSEVTDVTNRVVEELPWQLEKSVNYSKLRDTISTGAICDILFGASHQFDLVRYWRVIEHNTNMNAASSYQAIIREGRYPPGVVRSDFVFRVASFLDMIAKYEAAEQLYRIAKNLYEHSSQPLQVVKVDLALAKLASIQQRLEEAEKILNETLQILIKEKGPTDVEVGTTLDQLAVVYFNQNKLDLAEQTIQKALKILEPTLGTDHLLISDCYYDLACVYLSQRKLQDAEEMLKNTLTCKEKNLGEWHLDVARILNRLGTLYVEMDQFNDAEFCFKQALMIRETKLGPMHSRVAQTYKSMISLYEMLERYEDAIDCCEKALTITRKIFGAKHHFCSNILIREGVIYFLMKRSGDGKKVLEEAINILTLSLGPDHKETKEAKNVLEELEAPPKVHLPPPPPPPPIPIIVKATPPPIPIRDGQIPPPPPPPPVKKPVVNIVIAKKPAAVGPPVDASYLSSSYAAVPTYQPQQQQQQQQQKQVQAQAPAISIQEELANFGMSKLKHQSKKADRSDAKEIARAMLGQKDRKIMRKELK